MTLALRPYQQKAIDDLYNYFCENTGNPIVIIPGGGGKSYVMAEWFKLVFDIDPQARILSVTSRKELIDQNYKELKGIWPEAPAGIYSASLKRKQINARILFAGIQSIHSKAYKVQQCDMVIIDECQDISFKDETMYRKFLADLKAINPHLKIIGFTATHFRNDGGYLHEGENALFTDVAHETPITELFDEGYLTRPARPSVKPGDFRLSANGIGSRGGDYIPAQVEVPAMMPEAIDAIVTQTIEHGRNRAGWFVYGATNNHCRALEDEFRRRGIAVASIFGDSLGRDADLDLFKEKKLQCLVSNGVLTTGINVKHLDMLVLAMLTKSVNKYAQIILRGTRTLYADGYNLDTKEGRIDAIANGPKPDFLVLDFGENISRNGPIDNLNVPSARKKGEKRTDPLVKYCPECEADNPIAASTCYCCGHEFPPPERKVFSAPSTASIMTEPPKWYPVDNVAYSIHCKMGKPDSLKVTYLCGLASFSEWICLEHDGYAKRKADSWWLKYAQSPAPEKISEALLRTGEIAAISEIQVKKSGKYTEIVGRRLTDVERITA